MESNARAAWHTVRDEPGRYLVQDVDLDGVTLSRTVLAADASTRGHEHPHAELLFVLAGAGTVVLGPGGPDGTHVGERLTVLSGDVVKIAGGRHHRVEALLSGIEFVCGFAGDRAASVYGAPGT